MAFRFRLAKALEWYRERSQLETNRLCAQADAVAKIRTNIASHWEECRTLELEVIQSRTIDPQKLSALESWRRGTREVGLKLERERQKREQALEQQRAVALEAQRRFRLTEKLRDRRLAEHQYEEERQLEELASDSYLAAFARRLASPDPKT